MFFVKSSAFANFYAFNFNRLTLPSVPQRNPVPLCPTTFMASLPIMYICPIFIQPILF